LRQVEIDTALAEMKALTQEVPVASRLSNCAGITSVYNNMRASFGGIAARIGNHASKESVLVDVVLSMQPSIES